MIKLTLTSPHSCPADIPACLLVLATRGGPVAGGDWRAERDELAALVGPGELADLLLSDRPVRVLALRDGYEFHAD